jgi:ATP-dependent DNA helicase PIF1
VCLAPKILELKVGAQVMLLKNLNTPHLVNGSQGTIVGFDTIFNATGKSGGDGTRFPIVAFKNGFKVLLGREHWEREVLFHQGV